MYLVSGLVPGPSLGPGLGLEKVPVFGPNRPSRCPGCQALEFRWVRPECLICLFILWALCWGSPRVNKYIYFYMTTTISCTVLPHFTTESSRHIPRQRAVTVRSLTLMLPLLYDVTGHIMCPVKLCYIIQHLRHVDNEKFNVEPHHVCL